MTYCCIQFLLAIYLLYEPQKKTELQVSVTSETNYTGLGHTSQIKGIVLHRTGFTIDIDHSS